MAQITLKILDFFGIEFVGSDEERENEQRTLERRTLTFFKSVLLLALIYLGANYLILSNYISNTKKFMILVEQEPIIMEKILLDENRSYEERKSILLALNYKEIMDMKAEKIEAKDRDHFLNTIRFYNLMGNIIHNYNVSKNVEEDYMKIFLLVESAKR